MRFNLDLNQFLFLKSLFSFLFMTNPTELLISEFGFESSFSESRGTNVESFPAENTINSMV